MKKFIAVILTVLALGIGNYAVAQDNMQQFLIADGSSSGTYKQFLTEIVKGIADPTSTNAPVNFVEIQSSGAVENLDKLVNNECMGAFMHSDVLWHRNKSEPDAKLDNKFQTILALFPEDVQFVTLTSPRHFVTNVISEGVYGYGAKYSVQPVVVKSFADLNGKKVGAAGGGYITVSLIKLMSDVPYQIVKYDSGKEVLEALTRGDIDAAEFTGAAPLPNLKDLGQEYRILPIDGSIADKLSLVYKKSTVTYTKMNPQPIHTVSAQCLFVGKVYKSKRMKSVLSNFRKSFFEHLDDIKETPGNHKKWQEVDADTRGIWPWMDLGDGTSSTIRTSD